MTHTATRTKLARLGLFGLVTILLYLLMFLFEDAIVGVTQHGHWSFFIPIAFAFAFSYFHGHFTGSFWDAMGIRANQH